MTKEELLKRFANRACKKLPNDASLQERKDVSRIKREIKGYMNSKYPEPVAPYILANISRHHENYGETMQENMNRMLEKNS